MFSLVVIAQETEPPETQAEPIDYSDATNYDTQNIENLLKEGDYSKINWELVPDSAQKKVPPDKIKDIPTDAIEISQINAEINRYRY